MNKYTNWIYRSLDIGLAVNGAGQVEVVVKDPESGVQGNLIFDRPSDTAEDMMQRIGEEVYSWLSLMFDQVKEKE